MLHIYYMFCVNSKGTIYTHIITYCYSFRIANNISIVSSMRSPLTKIFRIVKKLKKSNKIGRNKVPRINEVTVLSLYLTYCG